MLHRLPQVNSTTSIEEPFLLFVLVYLSHDEDAAGGRRGWRTLAVRKDTSYEHEQIVRVVANFVYLGCA